MREQLTRHASPLDFAPSAVRRSGIGEVDNHNETLYRHNQLGFISGKTNDVPGQSA